MQETNNPRPGRRFEPVHELALLQPALNACAALPGAGRGLLVVREMTGPFGIPDLTALVGDPKRLRSRLELGVPPLLNRADAGIVSATHPAASLSAQQISERLHWPEDTIVRRLPGLVRIGALNEVRAGRFVRPAALAPLGRLYVVEAKVKEWGRALKQARKYSVWADGYVLVMGPLSAAVTQELEVEVDRDRAGLVVAGRWIRRPVMHRLPNVRRLWAAEHLVDAVRTTSSSA